MNQPEFEIYNKLFANVFQTISWAINVKWLITLEPKEIAVTTTVIATQS